jgi:hypothetical protein
MQIHSTKSLSLDQRQTILQDGGQESRKMNYLVFNDLRESQANFPTRISLNPKSLG